MKHINIWKTSGELVLGGIFTSKKVFLDWVEENVGHKEVAEAEILWDESTKFSLSDYLGGYKIRVRDCEPEAERI
jgi:hypothetical protein